MRNLQLSKPLVFLDIESTGINVGTDRIIEISLLKVHPEGQEESLTLRVNPTIPIPPESSRIHGIFDQDVADEPSFAERANEIAGFIKGCDLGGYNSNKFDIPLLAEEFARAGVDIDLKKMRLVDVQVIFFKNEPRTLSAAYQFYCQKNLEHAHTAEADVRATWEIFQAQLERYDNLSENIDEIASFSSNTKSVDFAGRIVYNDKGDECFNFGKHKGKKVLDVFSREPGYYAWMMQGDFPEYTKRVITRIYLKLRDS